MTKVLESSLSNLEYLMAALTLLGVLYLCYKRSGMKITLSQKSDKSNKLVPKTTGEPIYINTKSMPAPSLPFTALSTSSATSTPRVPRAAPWNWYRPKAKEGTLCDLASRTFSNQPAQTADSPFDDSRLSLIDYEIPTIVQEPRMSPDGHIIDNIERFRPHMKRV